MPWISAEPFAELVSGRRRGPLAALARTALGGAEVIYSAAIRWRNRRYDRHRASVDRVNAAVLSVGNLTLGGTGKTPMVEYLARWFGQRGVKVAILSRGYGGSPGGGNDEARELAEKLPGVPHEQSADRIAAARAAIARYGSELLILDDGFQHRRLHRDLDLVMLDATEPFGFSRVFPRGLLREPVAGLSRAHVVVLSRSDLVVPERRLEIRRSVECFAPQALWAESVHAPRHVRDCSGQQWPVGRLAGQPIAAFCGVGNPPAFRILLEQCGARLLGLRSFADHHVYTPRERAELAAWARGLGAATLVCTHKDLVKLNGNALHGVPVAALVVELDLNVGRDALETRLLSLLGQIHSQRRTILAHGPPLARRRSA